MGGIADFYVPPTKELQRNSRVSTFDAHNNRSTPSREPGLDIYTPVGTPLYAAWDGIVSEVNIEIPTNIYDQYYATGRLVRLNLATGLSCRYLHMLETHVYVGQRVKAGQEIGLSGATGYGELDWSWNVAGTGGAHVHFTMAASAVMRFGQRPNNNMIDPWPLLDFDYWTEKDVKDMHAGRIINVLPSDTYNFPTGGKIPEANGTLKIARVGGDFVDYPADANGRYPDNLRGIVSFVDYDNKAIPTLTRKDFKAVETAWKAANGK